jgi:hypothetical protein
VGFEPTIPVLERAKTVGIRHADHVAASIRKKLALTSVGIVRLRTEAMEFFYMGVMLLLNKADGRRFVTNSLPAVSDPRSELAYT